MKENEDFLRALGSFALASRMKRISDKLTVSGRTLYKTLNIDIEPGWLLVLKLLDKYDTLSITEIADKLYFAHPSIISMVTKMSGKGYLNSSKDKADKRKQLLSLSPKGKTILIELKPVWNAYQKMINSLMVDKFSLLKELNHIDKKLRESNFSDQILSELGHGENV